MERGKILKKGCTTGILAMLLMVPATLRAADPDEANITAFEEMFGEHLQEEDVYRADRLLITATGSLKPVHLAPSVASVITKEDIEEMGATTLDEVLETVPGLHVGIGTTGLAGSPIYSIRGIHTVFNPQLLLLIDGIPHTLAQTGSRPYQFRMPVANISRIEVVRGPGSAVHGADAFAGTINIITKDGQEIGGTQTGVRGGSFDTYDAWLQHGGNYGGWDLAGSLEYVTSQGDDDRIVGEDLQTIFDNAFRTAASLAPGPMDTDKRIFDGHISARKDNWTARFWTYAHDDTGLGTGVSQTLSPDSYADGEWYQGEINYHNDKLRRDWALDLRFYYIYSYNYSYLTILPPGTVLPIGADGNLDTLNPVGLTTFTNGYIGSPYQIDQHLAGETALFYSGFNQHLVRFGTGYKYIKEDTEEYKNFGPGVINGTESVVDGTLTNVTDTAYVYQPEEDRKITFLSLQDEWAFVRNWELTAGVRYDNYSDFGNTVNPRLALVWQTRADLTSKLLYGRAFRPPSFAELYAQNNPTATGNPDLDPETIDTLELAFDYQPLVNLRTIVNVFAYEINDLIDYVRPPGEVNSIAQNAKDQKGHGFELEADWQATKTIRLRGNFAYQRAKDKETDQLIHDAPGMQFYVNAHWQFQSDWSLDGQYFWIADRHRAAGDLREDIDDYDLVNMTLRRKNIFMNLDAALAVRNLFDEDAREPGLATQPNDYPLEGRSFWAELRYSF
ncbi:MAG: TonB-dependent receptor [Thermodesulfobacteriota bacterium]